MVSIDGSNPIISLIPNLLGIVSKHHKLGNEIDEV